MTKLTTMTNRHGILGCGALIGFLIAPSAGCGGSDTGSSSGSKTGAAASSATANMGAGGAAGGSAINDLINMFTMPMCETGASNVDSCGGVSCPAPSSNAAMAMGGLMGCTISCCTADNRCGTRNADQRFMQIVGSMCMVPAVADQSCPSMNFGNMAIPGCCDSSNHCGQLLGAMCLSGGLIGGFGGAAPQTVACGGSGDAAH